MPRGAREAKARLGVDDRRLDPGLRKARNKWRRFGRGIRRDVLRSLRGVHRDMTNLVGAGAVAGFAVVGRQVLRFEDQMSRLQIQAGTTNQEMAAFRSTVDGLSRSTGISRDELLDGAVALVDLQGAAGFSADQLKVLARANLATGTSMRDLAGLTFALGNAFNIADPNDLERGLSGIVTAGKEGAVPLNQMAQVLQRVAVTFKEVGGEGTAGAADMAAAIQILRRGFGTAEEAGTGLEALVGGLAKKAPELKKLGVDVFNTAGEFNDLRVILDQFAAAGLSAEELFGGLGRKETVKALLTLLENRRSREVDGKTLKGFEEIATAARDSNAVQEDADKRRQSRAHKLQLAFNRMKLAIADAFTPQRIEKFVGLVEKLADLIELVADNLGLSAAAWAAFKVTPTMLQFATLLATTGGQGLGTALGVGKMGPRAARAAAATARIGKLSILGAVTMTVAKGLINVAEEAQERRIKDRADTAFFLDQITAPTAQRTRTIERLAREERIVDKRGAISEQGLDRFASRTTSNPLEALHTRQRAERAIKAAQIVNVVNQTPEELTVTVAGKKPVDERRRP